MGRLEKVQQSERLVPLGIMGENEGLPETLPLSQHYRIEGGALKLGPHFALISRTTNAFFSDWSNSFIPDQVRADLK